MLTTLPTRPIIPGFHPDPSVCRAGDWYYLACSSFEYAPGVPLYRSRDLRAWEQVGHILDRPAQLALEGAPPSGGVYAPTLRHHDGRFWMITSNVSERPGQLLFSAEDPAGPWSDPTVVPEARGIDPDIAWDEAGNCYLTLSGYDKETGASAIVQALLDPATGALLSEPRQLWSGTGGKYPEAPHLYHIGDYWYLLIAEGGTERAHAATVARSHAPSGPFEPAPGNPLLTARGSLHPVQSAGHGDLIQAPDGTWAIVYLGTRPRGYTPEWHVLGRETFASVITWADGWPRLAGPIEPEAVAVREDLAGPGLPLSWVAPGRFPARVLRFTGGAWRMAADGSGDPVFAGRRQEHLACRVTADVTPGDGVGGLEVRIDPRHYVRLEAGDGRVRTVAGIGPVRSVLGEATVAGTVTLELRIGPPEAWTDATAGPDQIVAGISGPGGFTELGRLDGRYLSTEVAGGFTGRLVGLSCSRGELAVRAFRYQGADDPVLLDEQDPAAVSAPAR